MEFLGPSLCTVLDSYGDDQIDPEDLLRLAKQILDAVATVHDAGFGHGGTGHYTPYMVVY